MQNTDAGTALYILGKKSDGTNKWYVGTDSDETRLNIYNYITGSQVSLGTTVGINKPCKSMVKFNHLIGLTLTLDIFRQQH